MSHPYPRPATVALRRADFLALGHAVLGAGFLALAVWYAIEGESGFEVAGYGGSGLILFALAGYYRQHPRLIERGMHPTPRRWVALTGFVVGGFVVLLAVVYAIGLLF